MGHSALSVGFMNQLGDFIVDGLVTIGRNANGTIHNVIDVLDAYPSQRRDATVSRNHAVVKRLGSDLWVMDAASRNGTAVCLEWHEGGRPMAKSFKLKPMRWYKFNLYEHESIMLMLAPSLGRKGKPRLRGINGCLHGNYSWRPDASLSFKLPAHERLYA